MPDIDLGVATDWIAGDPNGRVKLQPSPKYPNSPKKDVLVSSPQCIEIAVNTNFETPPSGSMKLDKKIYFTTTSGGQKKIIAILDADGNLSIAGKVIQGQSN